MVKAEPTMQEYAVGRRACWQLRDVWRRSCVCVVGDGSARRKAGDDLDSRWRERVRRAKLRVLMELRRLLPRPQGAARPSAWNHVLGSHSGGCNASFFLAHCLIGPRPRSCDGCAASSRRRFFRRRATYLYCWQSACPERRGVQTEEGKMRPSQRWRRAEPGACRGATHRERSPHGDASWTAARKQAIGERRNRACRSSITLNGWRTCWACPRGLAAKVEGLAVAAQGNDPGSKHLKASYPSRTLSHPPLFRLPRPLRNPRHQRRHQTAF